jgi:shikimate kinase
MNAAHHPPPGIVLIGFMGCGKSTVGHELHKMLRYPKIDTDHLLVEREGRPITEIFAESGEEAFRDMESALLRELAADPPDRCIVSTGGGIILREENRLLLRRLGCVVWLQVPFDTILERVGRNRNRPLLNGPDTRRRAETLLAERKPLYREAAHIAIEVEDLTANEVACGILESVRYFFTSGKAS